MTAARSLVVAVGTAGSGSCGATTIAVGLAGALAGVMVEADPDGGVLAARAGMSLHADAPLLGGLLAHTSVNREPFALERVAQRLGSGVWAVVSPSAMDTATGLAVELAGRLGAVRALFDVPIVVDVGRLRPGTSSWTIAADADVVLVVAAPTVAAIDALLGRVARLGQLGRVGVVVNGQGSFTAGEIYDELARRRTVVQVVAALPDDPRGAHSLLTGGRCSTRGGLSAGLAGLAGMVLSAPVAVVAS